MKKNNIKKKVFGALVMFIITLSIYTSSINNQINSHPSLSSIIGMAFATGGEGGANKTDALAYCSVCGGRLCTACTTKYSNGCSVTENCTINY